jgi:hypothetical protein
MKKQRNVHDRHKSAGATELTCEDYCTEQTKKTEDYTPTSDLLFNIHAFPTVIAVLLVCERAQ